MKKRLKLAIHITVAILIAAILAALITGGAILFSGLGSKGQFTYLIVLGTTVEGTEPSPTLRDRIEAAAKYMEAHPDVIAVVTGGKGDETNLSEAQCMFNTLVESGIDPGRILMEDQATSTAENFQFSLALLEKNLGRVPQNIGILSSEFHLLRAQMLAKAHGLNASTIPANTSDANTFFTYFLREIAMVWYEGLRILLT